MSDRRLSILVRTGSNADSILEDEVLFDTGATRQRDEPSGATKKRSQTSNTTSDTGLTPTESLNRNRKVSKWAGFSSSNLFKKLIEKLKPTDFQASEADRPD